MPGIGQADDHRPARRRDAGVRAGGALLGARARSAGSTPSCPTTGSPSTTSTSTSRRARCPRTAPRPGSRWRPRSPRWSAAGRSRSDVAMTGEVTLTGQVLPVGGLKEKSLAAQRAGIKRVIVPDRNEGEILEIPEHERAGLEFVYVDRIEKALEAAIRRIEPGSRAASRVYPQQRRRGRRRGEGTPMAKSTKATARARRGRIGRRQPVPAPADGGRGAARQRPRRVRRGQGRLRAALVATAT